MTPANDELPDTDGPDTDTDATADVIAVRHGLFGTHGTGDTSGYGGLVAPISLPRSTPAPLGGYFDDLVATLLSALGDDGTDGNDGNDGNDAVERVIVFADELTLHIRSAHLPAVASALRDHPDLRFELCLGASGVHYPDFTGRELHVVYPLASIVHNRRVRLEVSVPDADPHVPSLHAIYPTTDWHERETWDFFGVVFDGHPNLTRIEMPDDWVGHPQRKDYPLGGIPVEFKGARIAPPDQRRSYT